MSYLDRIAACRRYDAARYRPFRVGGLAVGEVEHGFAETLAGFPEVFRVDRGGVALAPGIEGFEARTRAVDGVLRRLRERGLIGGWRDEPYPVGVAFSGPPLMAMERAAVPLFGVRAYGVHVNGVVAGGGATRMWIATRSLSKPTGPGKLDQIVAGGQPVGLSLAENLAKECAEEAGIPAAIVARARPVGTVSYRTERSEGLRNDVLFNYDLELPAGFEPVNTDGEVEFFELMTVDDVAAIVSSTDRFKFNCALVVIDFLVRRGFIAPDDPDYVDIVAGLHG